MTHGRPVIGPFPMDAIDDAARLLAARHAAQRAVEPGLDPAYEDPAVARAEIEALLATEGSTGALATRGETAIGYLIGTPRAASWGPNVWVEGAGHAVAPGETEVLRDLYASLADGWVAAGITSHYAVVPASDAALVEVWTRVGFGQQHTHAIREVPGPESGPESAPESGPDDRRDRPPGIVIRLAERRDIAMLGRLELVLDDHQRESPVFSGQPPTSIEDAVNEYEEGFDDPRFTTFVAEHEGLVVGSAVACSIEVSSEHRGIVRPTKAGFLGFAAVLPEARGLGAGRALGEAVLDWGRDAGYRTVVTDWRETNLLSSRTWPRLGFRPTFRRMFRAIPGG